MKTPLRPLLSRRVALAFGISAAALFSPSAFAQVVTGFNQTAAGPFDYNLTTNWVGGTINGVWDASLALAAGQTVTFGASTALTTNLDFRFDGSNNLTLRADGTGPYTLTLGGDINLDTVNSSRTVTFGSTTANQGLNVDLGGATRTFSVTAITSSSRSLTFTNNVTNGGLILNGGGNVNLNGTANTLDSIRLQNTAFRMTGVSTANSSTTLSGNLIIDGGAVSGGASTVTLTPNAGRNLALSANNLSRENHGVVFFRGTNLGGTLGANGAANITFTNAPALVGGGGAANTTNISILPWAVGSTTAGGAANSFVTYDAVNGIRVLDTANEFITLNDAFSSEVSGADNNVRVGVGQTVTLSGDHTVNSLVVGESSAGGTFLNGTGTLTVTSGAVLLQRGTIGINLDFGSREGVIGETQGQITTISGSIAGSGGLTVYQPNTVTNSTSAGNGVTFSGASTFTGDLTVLGRISVTNADFFASGARTGNVNVYGIVDFAGGYTINGLNGTGSFRKSTSGTATVSIGDNDADGNFSGIISNNGATTIRKIGSGTQVFGGANTYTGGTQVDGGTLLITNTTGSGTGTGAIAVASGARFGGTGIATGAVTAASFDSVIVAGGVNSIGTLRLDGGLTANSGVTFAFDVNGAQIDSIDFGTASLNLGGTVTVDFFNLGSVQTGVAYSLFAGSGAWDSVSANFVFNGPSGYVLDSTYGGGNGYIFDDASNSFTVQFAAIPEPSSIALLGGFGALAFAGLRRRRRANSGE